MGETGWQNFSFNLDSAADALPAGKSHPAEDFFGRMSAFGLFLLEAILKTCFGNILGSSGYEIAARVSL